MALLPILPMLVAGSLFALLAFRLIASGKRSGGSERWLGCFFLGIAITAPLRGSVAVGLDVGFDPAAINWLGHAAMSAGMVCLAYFVWQVFRPVGNTGLVLFSICAALIAGQSVLFTITGAAGQQSHPANMAVVAAMLATIAWAFGESLRYWRMQRRRVELGLAEDVIANRFGLWTLWTGALMIIPILTLSMRLFAFATRKASQGAAVSEDMSWALDVIRAAVALCGPTIVVATWLIFYPPKRYLAYICARGPRAKRA